MPMSRVENNRVQLQVLWGNRPFEPFAINLENGDRAVVEHPENLAFDPTENGRDGFVLLSAKSRYFSSFAAVTSLAILDDAEVAA